jgi:hypothetical protein
LIDKKLLKIKALTAGRKSLLESFAARNQTISGLRAELSLYRLIQFYEAENSQVRRNMIKCVIGNAYVLGDNIRVHTIDGRQFVYSYRNTLKNLKELLRQGTRTAQLIRSQDWAAMTADRRIGLIKGIQKAG